MNKRFGQLNRSDRGIATLIYLISTGLFCNLAFGQQSEIEKTIAESIPQLKSTDKGQRETALGRVHSELMASENPRQSALSSETRKQLSQELIRLYTNTKPADYSSPIAHQRILQEIALHGDNDVAKPFLLRALEEGSPMERDEILAVIGRGTISGDDLYTKIEILAAKGRISPESKPALLARINKTKALSEILKEVREARSKNIFLYSAWALQNNYKNPAHYRLILPRIKELGLDKPRSFKRGDGLFWIDVELLSQYLELTTGKDLQIALDIVSGDSTLCQPPMAAVLIKKLDDSDSKNRIYVAKALRKSLGFSQTDQKQVKAAIRIAIDKERDPDSKVALERTLEQADHSGEERRKYLQHRASGEK